MILKDIELCISFVKVLCISFHVGGITNKKQAVVENSIAACFLWNCCLSYAETDVGRD